MVATVGMACAFGGDVVAIGGAAAVGLTMFFLPTNVYLIVNFSLWFSAVAAETISIHGERACL